jgi:hypothetical protein
LGADLRSPDLETAVGAVENNQNEIAATARANRQEQRIHSLH